MIPDPSDLTLANPISSYYTGDINIEMLRNGLKALLSHIPYLGAELHGKNWKLTQNKLLVDEFLDNQVFQVKAQQDKMNIRLMHQFGDAFTLKYILECLGKACKGEVLSGEYLTKYDLVCGFNEESQLGTTWTMKPQTSRPKMNLQSFEIDISAEILEAKTKQFGISSNTFLSCAIVKAWDRVVEPIKELQICYRIDTGNQIYLGNLFNHFVLEMKQDWSSTSYKDADNKFKKAIQIQKPTTFWQDIALSNFAASSKKPLHFKMGGYGNFGISSSRKYKFGSIDFGFPTTGYFKIPALYYNLFHILELPNDVNSVRIYGAVPAELIEAFTSAIELELFSK